MGKYSQQTPGSLWVLFNPLHSISTYYMCVLGQAWAEALETVESSLLWTSWLTDPVIR